MNLLFPSSLQVLNLRMNQLSSTPKGYSEICRLMYLRELDLSGNFLTNMPYCLGNISLLRTLDLSDNQLNGNLSSLVSRLPSTLEYLSLLAVGRIQAHVESSWVPLFQLKTLKLQNFILGSTIPGFLVHQHELRFIDLSHNELTGAFPTWLVQNNTKLHTTLLNYNLLTKLQLPRLVHGLKFIDISSNRIYDPVQHDIGIVFPMLRYMNFSSNHFHGTIPSSMGEMKSLETLDMSSNFLSGQLPKAFLNGCYSLWLLKLSNNQLQGEIFPMHANLTGLSWLFLDENNFNGSLGKGLLNSKNLRLLEISDNSFSGMLPLWIGKISRLGYLYMRGNQLKGLFPRQLQNIHNTLIVIDISHNSFYGPIPRNYDFFVSELRLQNNEFIGTIPGNLFNSGFLQVLDLRNNNFSGMNLKTIGKTSQLRVLILGNNSFQTHIPVEMCQLSGVGFVDLSHNRFKGVIPSCLGNMYFGGEEYNIGDFVEQLYNLNNLTSDFSLYDIYYEGSRHLAPKTIVDFFSKNRYEAFQGDILYYMYGLDLSNNQLSGEIPVEIGNLKNIISLNLSRNLLTGYIPDSISKLKDLGSLDLSNNKLDGNIPAHLADLNNLGYFNVSFNNLSGEIPFNGHLITFDEKSYIGNAHLCGLVINKSCNPTRVQELSASNKAKEEDDGVIDIVWFYWTCVSTYIFTSMALFAFLCIDSRWSREWFYRVDLFVHYLQHLKVFFACNSARM